MTLEALIALEAFKTFVATLSYDDGEDALAEQLGRAKSLWTEAATALSCVRKLTHRYEERPPPSRRQAAATPAPSPPTASDIDTLIG